MSSMENYEKEIIEQLCKEFNLTTKQAINLIEKFFKGFRKAIDKFPDKVSIKNFGEFNKTKITDRHKYRRMIKLRKQHNRKVKKYLNKNPHQKTHNKVANKKKEL